MKTRVMLAILLVLATLPLAAGPLVAAEQAPITCAVTVDSTLISVSVSTTATDFGFMPPNAVSSSATYTVTHTGNVQQDILVRGTDASNETSGTWALSPDTGTDQYKVVQRGTVDAVTLTTTPQLASILLQGSLWGAADHMVLELWTPNDITEAGTYRFDVIYSAVKFGP